MQEVIVDTDILSEILKGRDSQVERHRVAYEIQHRQLTIASVSIMEILTGYRKRGATAQRERASALFDRNIEVVPDAADYRLAAVIIGDLLRDGKVIGVVDPLIAACAIRQGYGVASGNTRHYEFIQEAGYGFRLVNWRNP